jgi:hypothetical protein
LNVFISAISLAFGALSFAVPVSSLGTGAAVAVCFSPEEDCTAFAVDAIDRAETQILVTAYGLTTGSSTVEALVRAKQRGVDVRIIADRTTPCERKSGIGPLAEAGVPIWIDRNVRIAHSKSMVIDGKVTLTGSMNWTGTLHITPKILTSLHHRSLQPPTPGIGISASHCRCPISSEKIGAVARNRWASNRKRRRDKSEEDNRPGARGVFSHPRECSLKRPQPPEIVGQIDNPVATPPGALSS